MEIIIFYLAFGAAILVSIADLLGFTKLNFIHKRIPTITLLLCGIILSYLTTINHGNQHEIKTNMESNKNKEYSELLSSLKSNISNKFKSEFNEFINESELFYKSAIEDEKLRLIIPREEYIRMYTQLISKNKDAHFYGMSNASNDYMWNSDSKVFNDLENQIKKHCSNGGKFTRIFFIMPNTKKEIAENIIKKQIEMGVKVYTIDIKKVPIENLRYFFWTSDLRIGGDGNIDKDSDTYEGYFTTQKSTLEEFRSTYNAILDLPGIEEK